MNSGSTDHDTSDARESVEDLLSNHARRRLNQRGIRKHLIDLVLEYGRAVYTRGACILVVGRKEVRTALNHGLDIRACEGIQVVCCPSDGIVVTAYRNRDFSGLKQGHVRHRRRNRCV